MKHLIKVPLPNSDMFISDVSDTHIIYSIRDSKGKLLESENNSKYEIKEDGKVYFDNRFLPVPYLEYIKECLK